MRGTDNCQVPVAQSVSGNPIGARITAIITTMAQGLTADVVVCPRQCVAILRMVTGFDQLF